MPVVYIYGNDMDIDQIKYYEYVYAAVIMQNVKDEVLIGGGNAFLTGMETSYEKSRIN